MTVKLRDYQLAAVEGVRCEARTGHRAIILCSATGSGKTKTAAAGIVLPAFLKGRRVLWVAALRELLDQAGDAIHEAGVPRACIGYVVGSDKKRLNRDALIQVCSIQTLARRPRVDADLVIIDECHLALASTYVDRIWEPTDGAPYPLVVGLTATPCLGDKRGLGSRFQAIVNVTTYERLIEQGFIDEPIVYAPKIGPDWSKLRVVAGEYTEESAAEAMGGIAGNIVPTWFERAEGRSTILYACTIAHSKDLARRFCEAGVAAEHLDGSTPELERMRILADLKSGKLTMVCNVNVLTAGFDAPNVRCVIVARPTKSIVFHRQTSGRCLRPGTQKPVILDFANNTAEHGLPTMDFEWTLEGKQKTKGEVVGKTCPECYAYVSGGCSTCPHCGAEFPRGERKETVEHDNVEMALVTQIELESNYYMGRVLRAKESGYKPWWAAKKFEEKFGRLPPGKWTNNAAQDFAEDETWQEAVRVQAARREKYARK